MKKRFVSLMLAMAMLMSFMPVIAMAETGTNYGDYLYYETNDDNTAVTITDCGTSATEVIIPSEIDGLPVTSIGDWAFYDCKSLTNIDIPNSVTHIGDFAFRDCSSLISINADENNQNYSSQDGNLFSKDKTTLIQYAIGKTDAQYTIPDSVISIGNSAFYHCVDLTSVTIGSGVKSIGEEAFGRCTGLKSVTIGNGVASVKDYAFLGCSSLTDVYYGGSKEQWEEVSVGINDENFTSAEIHYSITEGESTPIPTNEPEVEHTCAPTTVPIAESTTAPTAEPTYVPTTAPTAEPKYEPTAEPTSEPEEKAILIYSPDNGDLIVENSPADGGKLIVAQYNAGTLKKVKTYKLFPFLAGSTVNFPLQEDFDAEDGIIKAMLWEIEEMKPLAEAICFTMGAAPDITSEPTVSPTFAVTEPTPSPTPETMLTDNEKYGWIMDISTKEETGETVLKLYSMDNEVIEATLNEAVDYWSPSDTSSAVYMKAEAAQEIQSLVDDNGFLKMSGGTPIKLVKYIINDETNKIVRLYCAVDASKVSDTEALRLDTQNMYAVPSVGGTVNGKLIKDNIIEFNVPLSDNAEYINNSDNYSVDKVKAYNYVVIENGSKRNYIVGEFSNSITPTLLVNFDMPIEVPLQFTDMSSAGSGPAVILASSGFEASDYDSKICTLSGQVGGAVGTLTTSKRTSIGQLKDSVWTATNNVRNYDTEMLWNYAEYDTSPESLIEAGDTLLTQGYRTARYVSVLKLYDYAVNGTEYGIIGNRPNKSTACVSYYLNALEYTKNASKPYIALKDCDVKFGVEDGTVFDLVKINKTTKEVACGTIEWDKLVPFDEETKTGDYLFISIANGELKRGIVYRFQEEEELEAAEPETVQPLNKLKDGEKYGWIMELYTGESGEDTVIKLYTQDNEAVEMSFGEEVEYWAPDGTSSETLSKNEAAEKITQLLNLNSFRKLGNRDSGAPIRLVKYSLNSDNKLVKLYCAAEAPENNNALTVSCTNLSCYAPAAGLVNGWNISDGIVEFNVPADTADMTNSKSYSVGEVNSANYVVRENGSERNYIVGEFVNEIDVCVVVNFVSSAYETASFTEMDSAGAGPSAMVVDTVSAEQDSDGNMVYKISGYNSSADVSITTNKNTNVGVFNTQSIWSGTALRYYGPESVWTAKESSDDLTDYLSKGDIILYTSDGRLIARYASARNDIKFTDGEISSMPVTLGNNPNSTARCQYYFNKVTDTDWLSDMAVVKIEGYDNNIVFDPSKLIDVVTVSADGRVEIEKDAATIIDIDPYCDYLWVSYINKLSSIGGMFIYRIKE